MEKPIVFEQERLDGLADKIAMGLKFNLTASIKPGERVAQEKAKNVPQVITASLSDQYDLFLFNSILCSTGNNKNDHYFLPSYMYRARETAKFKSVNLEHEFEDICGVVCESFLVDEDLMPLTVESEDDLPAKFHIMTESAIYLAWRNEERQKQIWAMVDEIEAGEWCVSMECLAPSYDYGFLADDGKVELVERTAETAFLSKYLSWYGGSGSYNGRRIVQVPKDYIFSGMAMTKTPANPESVVVTAKQDEKIENVYLSMSSEVNKKEGDFDMADDLKEIYTAIGELKASIASITSLHASVAGVTTELKEGFDVGAGLDSVKSEVVSLKASFDDFVKAGISEVGQLKVDVEAKDATIATLTEQVATLTASVTDLETKLAAEVTKQTKTTRTSQLIRAGLADEKAVEIVDGTIALTDEQFALVASNLTVPLTAKAETLPAEKTVETEVNKIETAEVVDEPINPVASTAPSQIEKLTTDFQAYWASSTTNKSKKSK